MLATIVVYNSRFRITLFRKWHSLIANISSSDDPREDVGGDVGVGVGVRVEVVECQLYRTLVPGPCAAHTTTTVIYKYCITTLQPQTPRPVTSTLNTTLGL